MNLKREFVLMADDTEKNPTAPLRQIGSMSAMRRVDTDEVLFTIKLNGTTHGGNIIAVPDESSDDYSTGFNTKRSG